MADYLSVVLSQSGLINIAMPKESKIGRPEALNASYFSHNESDSLKNV